MQNNKSQNDYLPVVVPPPPIPDCYKMVGGLAVKALARWGKSKN